MHELPPEGGAPGQSQNRVESREIANDLGHAALFLRFGIDVREMCGNGVQNQPKPAKNSEPKCNVF